MEREHVQELLAMIQGTYPNYKPPDKSAAVNAWTMALEEYDKNQVAAAFKSYMRTNASGFAPTPGQIIDLIQTITTPVQLNDMEAWSMVSKAIRNSAYNSVEEYAKLPELVQQAVGQPSQLRTWALDENYNENVIMSQFMTAYRSEVKRKQAWMKMPAPIRELIENVNKGSYKGEIGLKRTQMIKSSLESKQSEIKALTDAKAVSNEMSKQTKIKLEEMRAKI